MKQRHGSPTFYLLLEEMAETHDRKSHDYAHNSNPSGNYHFAGLVANLFSHSPEDAGFAGRMAEKIYRLSVLEGGRKQPKNESIDDTERDIAVIVALWMADRRNRRGQSIGTSSTRNGKRTKQKNRVGTERSHERPQQSDSEGVNDLQEDTGSNRERDSS